MAIQLNIPFPDEDIIAPCLYDLKGWCNSLSTPLYCVLHHVSVTSKCPKISFDDESIY